jgi:hypothetical protein
MHFGTTKEAWRKKKLGAETFVLVPKIVGSKVRHRADGIFVYCHDGPSAKGISDGDRPMKSLTGISQPVCVGTSIRRLDAGAVY